MSDDRFDHDEEEQPEDGEYSDAGPGGRVYRGPKPAPNPYRSPPPNPRGVPTIEEIEEHLKDYRRRVGIPEPGKG